jgi:hypothetical protein
MAYPGDPAIEACLQLINVRTHTRDELLRAEFTLRNASTQDLEGSWTVAWAGADGLPLSVPLGWSPFNLPPGASKALSITAPEPGAASWTLHAVDGDPNRGAN